MTDPTILDHIDRALRERTGAIQVKDAIMESLIADARKLRFVNEQGTARIVEGGKLACLDCAEPYASPRFHDLIIDDDAWRVIAPNHDEGGLLCPNCICARLEAAGLRNVGHKFTTGPLADGAASPKLNHVGEALAALAEKGAET